jgi:two-component system, chemotaxis family, CheB/CheR fusion protein
VQLAPVTIAIASSAGDLEAPGELLSALPAECLAAFVIVQHLDPAREKMLLETLSQRTLLPVMRAQDGTAAQQRHIYVLSANTTLTIHDGRLRVAASPGGVRHPGDVLFLSLAQEQGAAAVGVVLSGEGSDGAFGTQSIHRAGGLAFAQYPGSARFPSMPISAIETGCVDLVLRPNEIARQLALLGRKTPPVAAAGLAPTKALGADSDNTAAPASASL